MTSKNLYFTNVDGKILVSIDGEQEELNLKQAMLLLSQLTQSMLLQTHRSGVDLIVRERKDEHTS